MSVSTAKTVLSFVTDLVGLERILRGIQAIALFITADQLPSPLSSKHSSYGVASSVGHVSYNVQKVTTESIAPVVARFLPVPLGVVASWLVIVKYVDTARRFMRFFWFLDSFMEAQQTMRKLQILSGLSSTASTNLSIIGILSVLRNTFFGIHGFLDSALLLEGMGIPVWPTEVVLPLLVQECIRTLALAYACSALLNVVQLFKLDNTKIDARIRPKSSTAVPNDHEKKAGYSKELKSESDHGNRISEIAQERRNLVRQIVTDLLDFTVPASVLGWIDLDPVAVSIVMFTTTWLGGIGIWNRIQAN